MKNGSVVYHHVITLYDRMEMAFNVSSETFSVKKYFNSEICVGTYMYGMYGYRHVGLPTLFPYEDGSETI